MVKVLINGCNGKMGQEVAKEIRKTPDIEILCGVDRTDTGDNLFPVFTDANNIDLLPDVIIDFSVPVSTMNILEYARKNNLYISGGSDYHGNNKPTISLAVGKGNLRIPNEIVNWYNK